MYVMFERIYLNYYLNRHTVKNCEHVNVLTDRKTRSFREKFSLTELSHLATPDHPLRTDGRFGNLSWLTLRVSVWFAIKSDKTKPLRQCFSSRFLFVQTDNAGNQVEEGQANVTTAMTVLPGVSAVDGGHSRGSMDTRPPLHTKLIKKDQSRKSQSYKVESVSGGANMDMHNFSLENKRETEYVSQHLVLINTVRCRCCSVFWGVWQETRPLLGRWI